VEPYGRDVACHDHGKEVAPSLSNISFYKNGLDLHYTNKKRISEYIGGVHFSISLSVAIFNHIIHVKLDY
jgi:hypothetical protein